MTRVHHKEGDDFVDTLIGFSLKHPVPEVAQFAGERALARISAGGASRLDTRLAQQSL